MTRIMAVCIVLTLIDDGVVMKFDDVSSPVPAVLLLSVERHQPVVAGF